MGSKNDNGAQKNNSSNCSTNNPENPLVEFFFSLPPKQFSLLSSILGILLLKDLDLDQQNSLGNFLVNVGTNILTAAGQGQLLQSQKSQNDELRKKIERLKKQIFLLEEELDK
ncbi:MAG TPA: hypothetical protein DGK91_04060 [Clostridium sp.]|jgi:hypothetical protein|nr:hypothetical protein [Bacillota bacterium]NLP29291.1 hypothetical protein [Clostridia bacterium]HCW03771.1 hypothetical protein [Clostridium sp.]